MRNELMRFLTIWGSHERMRSSANDNRVTRWRRSRLDQNRTVGKRWKVRHSDNDMMLGRNKLQKVLKGQPKSNLQQLLSKRSATHAPVSKLEI